ncbi:hypothetical protein [Clostridium estertheticum]|uniref:Lipoprotein n=1 Tax=Clostridium estertheticum subsp. estertheticum TaxID=1552 RepID=A0A1J0GF12_9CLOT|nr:hypothetical protein [Clostridium estertheticum]APC39925.1 hypothetical protein A7L45_07490 [Clostridium estertheticum subsp. estertheticum]MBU3072580.1 hypothetical protein [Clostridium estertheticum]MBU3162673.1 hypothetical protein [Clostridium estertheticum]MBZ9614013.1 hypothetical protein [Clostridium estertheticum subsp. laramiense]WAG73967.1 hypothetical protein LL032_00465 [Clostridium estertheticum]
MKNTKISLTLISVSMTILLFTGCNMSNSTKAPMNNTNRSNQINKSNQSMSTASMKKLYSNTLKELVTAKTITNTQSKKVLSAITKNMSQGSVTNNSNVATPNTGTTGTPGATGSTGTTESTRTPGTKDTTGTGTVTGTGTTNSTNQTETTNNTNVINGLNSLVKSKVITQVQADTIQQKIQTNLENIQISK